MWRRAIQSAKKPQRSHLYYSNNSSSNKYTATTTTRQHLSTVPATTRSSVSNRSNITNSTMMFYRRIPTMALALATVACSAPARTMAEATTATKRDHSTTTTTTAAGGPVCKSYGCPLLPLEVYYNEDAKAALAKIREMKRDDVLEIASKATSTSSSSTSSTIDKTAERTVNADGTLEENNNDDAVVEVNASDLQVLKSAGHEAAATFTLIGYKGGTLESQINQDRSFCVSPYFIDDNEGNDNDDEKALTATTPITTENKDGVERKLLGVFDGHAKLGELVSEYTVTELPKLLATKLQSAATEPEKVQQALIETFVELDRTAPAEISGGCTASVILQEDSKLYVANAGDSRSFVVVYRANTQQFQVVYISREDKPSLPDERERVERMGGQVYLPLRGTSRVLYIDPTTGGQSGLAMSRSIGDWEAGKLGVIPDPIVGVLDIGHIVQDQIMNDCDLDDHQDGVVDPSCLATEDDVYIFAVSATDGMMDFAAPETIAQTVATSLYGKDGPHLYSALEQLIYMAAQGWEQARQGRYRDDIAISVAQIRIPPTAPAQ